MKTFTQKCVTITDFCKHNNLNRAEVMEALCHSEISFGSNYDTLVSQSQITNIIEDWLEKELNLDFGDDDVVVSLGS